MFLVTKLAELVSYFIIITTIMDLLQGQWLYQYTGDVTLFHFSNFTSSNLISHFIIVLLSPSTMDNCKSLMSHYLLEELKKH